MLAGCDSGSQCIKSSLWLFLVIQTEYLVVTSPLLCSLCHNFVQIINWQWRMMNDAQCSGVCFLWQSKSRPVTSKATNSVHYCCQVDCCEPIRSSSTGIGWHPGSTWQRSGLTGHRGSSSFWKRLTECLTRSLSRLSMRGTHTHIDK